MIDIENKFIDAVYRNVKSAYSKADVASVYVAKPSAFPHVTIWEESNESPSQYQEVPKEQRYATVTYLVNIYANDANKKKTAKAIAQIVDDTLSGLGLLRTFSSPVPNQDTTIYRITMRFRGVIEVGTTEGETTTYIVHHN